MYRTRLSKRRFRCFYCLVYLIAPVSDSYNGNHNHLDNIRTREHLIPLADGGDSEPDNVRWACRACNNYVGCWPLEKKLRYRILIRRVGGLVKLKSLFPKRSRNRHIAGLVDSIHIPDNDSEVVRARQAALRIKRKLTFRTDYRKVDT